jgi:hypothetical protein
MDTASDHIEIIAGESKGVMKGEGITFEIGQSKIVMEKGKISISVDAANKIARYLGLSKEVTYKIFFDEKVQDTSTETILANSL